MNTFLDLQSQTTFRAPMVAAHKEDIKTVPLMARIYDRGQTEQGIALIHPTSEAGKRMTKSTYSKRNIEYFKEMGFDKLIVR